MSKPSAALEKWLLVPDFHAPYHDKKAVALMLRAADRIGVRNVCLLGDAADCYAVSSHSKDPKRSRSLKAELDGLGDVLGDIEATCTGQRKYIFGNHEDRIDRYIADTAPALAGLISIEQYLGLEDRGWETIPYKSDTKIGKLFLTHDIGKAGKFAHYDALSAYQGNVVIGHTHRLGFAVEGSARGKTHVGAMLGWLGDFSKVDYMCNVRARRDWVHGFGLAYREVATGYVHLVPVPIVDGRVVVEGHLIK